MDNVFGAKSHRSIHRNSPSADSWRSPAGKASYDTAVKSSEYGMFDNDYYKSSKKIYHEEDLARTFYPITEQWQKEKAEKFNIKLVKSFEYGYMKNFYDRTPPKKTISVQADGNCFFRAICTCITGSENEHMRIRELITKHVEENPDMYRTFLQSRGGMNQYLTSMRRPREWATDVEILAAATLLKTVIEVYFPCRVKGNIQFSWQTFKPLTHPDITYPAIYLSNKNDHFDPVLDVCVEDMGGEAKTKSETAKGNTFSSSHDNSDASIDPFSSKYTESMRKRLSNQNNYTSSLSERNSHESSFHRIYNRTTDSNFLSSSSRNRETHPNVSQF